MEMVKQIKNSILITAGSAYLDIDAYACVVAMAELLRLQGENAIAYSKAPCNYSVCSSLIASGQILRELPVDVSEQDARYIVVDVSDPEFLKSSVSLERVVEVYDHHVGFEDFWSERIGDGSHIEFIGAAATLIYRQWQKTGLQDRMSRKTALLLISAILDNTLNLTSNNMTQEDRDVYFALCAHAHVGEEFRAEYFSEVQKSVEADLKNAIFGDIKTIRDNTILPSQMAQLCVWDADSILARIDEIRGWFKSQEEPFMINIIDLHLNCSYFVCDSEIHQRLISQCFCVSFISGVAKASTQYLRKEMIKKTKLLRLMEDNTMVELGFIHGRFQLFHNDHLQYALLAKEKCKKLIVGITSPENATLIREDIDPHRSEEASNPFTYYERFNMIKLALLEAGISREDFEIVPYPIERPEILYNYVPLSATSFFTIYDDWGYEKLHRLGELGYGTHVLFDKREKAMCSTEIRHKIVNGDDWSHMVPKAVYGYIVENGLTEKVIRLLKK